VGSKHEFSGIGDNNPHRIAKTRAQTSRAEERNAKVKAAKPLQRSFVRRKPGILSNPSIGKEGKGRKGREGKEGKERKGKHRIITCRVMSTRLSGRLLDGHVEVFCAHACTLLFARHGMAQTIIPSISSLCRVSRQRHRWHRLRKLSNMGKCAMFLQRRDEAACSKFKAYAGVKMEERCGDCGCRFWLRRMMEICKVATCACSCHAYEGPM